SVAQTVDLDPGKDYIFRMDFDTDSKAKYIVRVYPGENTSGNGWIGQDEGKFVKPATITKSADGVQHLKLELNSAENAGKATVVIRHVPEKGKNTDAAELQIYRVGFYLKADYELQNMVHDLFKDAAQTQLVYKGDTVAEAIENIENLIKSIERKRDDGTHYHVDVLTYVNETLDKAKGLLKQVVDAKNAIDAEFDNRPIDEETFTQLQKQVNGIGSDDFRKVLTQEVELVKKKQDTLDALDQEAEAAKSAVDDLDGLSKEEKSAKKDQIDQALNDAKDKIDEATSTNAVEKTKNDGSLAIEKEK